MESGHALELLLVSSARRTTQAAAHLAVVLQILRPPRQPFVGLVLSAAAGILVADFWPMPGIILLCVVVIAGISALVRPHVSLTYAIVFLSFIWLHSAAITGTPAQALAASLGPRARAVNVTGPVITEPKAVGSGPASFLLRLRSIQLEGRAVKVSATILVRWKGTAEFGDDLAL